MMDTSNLTFTIGECYFITIEDWGLSTVVSADYVRTGYINDGTTMGQRWINDGSTMHQREFLQCVTPEKTKKTENSNLHGFELHRPSSKGTKWLIQILQAIINQRKKNVLLVTCSFMECENTDETAWSRQNWQSKIATAMFMITIKYSSLLTIFSAEHVGTTESYHDGSTMDQLCIVGTSIVSTCSSWWPVARTRITTSVKERQRQSCLSWLTGGGIWCELEHLFLEKLSL